MFRLVQAGRSLHNGKQQPLRNKNYVLGMSWLPYPTSPRPMCHVSGKHPFWVETGRCAVLYYTARHNKRESKALPLEGAAIYWHAAILLTAQWCRPASDPVLWWALSLYSPRFRRHIGMDVDTVVRWYTRRR